MKLPTPVTSIGMKPDISLLRNKHRGGFIGVAGLLFADTQAGSQSLISIAKRHAVLIY
jgi:hypothetical protein